MRPSSPHGEASVLRPLSQVGADARARPEDNELHQRALAGEQEAWAQLYRRHYPSVYRRLRLLLGQASVAEELSQECFLVAMRKLEEFRGGSKLSTWLHGIAHNLARNHWRKSNNGLRAFEQLRQDREVDVSSRPTPEQGVHQLDRINAIYQALETLPEKLRIVFVLREIEQVSAREVACELGTTINNVNVRANRARNMLRETLIARGWMKDGDVG